MQTGQTNSQTSLQVSVDKVYKAIAQYGEQYRPLVFDKYNKATGMEKAVAAKAPTFHDVTNHFSEDAMLFWLRYHIADTFAFCGIYDQASKRQIIQTAELIIQHEIYGQLTLSEFLCFLQRFKQGRYDKIYSSNHPNPQEFLKCLQPFWNDLCYERGKQAEKERQERLERDRNSPNNMTRAEWEEIKMLTRMYEMQINR